ncbi:MAG: FAD-dependent oxidoreductase [Bacteroidota bacterium]
MAEKPVILTVDDDPQVLRAVARDLRRQYGAEYRIVRANSGTQGIEVLKTLSEKQDPLALILSDQRMPQVDGVELLDTGRSLFPQSKRVLLTAYADTDAAINAINRSQIDYYLLKPWDPPEEKLYPILDDLLEDWRSGYRPEFTGVRVVGDRWSKESHEIRDFLARNQIPYRFLDIESNPDAAVLAQEAGTPGMPFVILPEGGRLEQPSLAELAEGVGLQTQAANPFYDFAIVGGGPAGLAAAVYAASEGLNTVLIEGEAPGGQAGTSSRIENYLGFPAGLSGSDLARRAVTQARKFGVEILSPLSVERVTTSGPYKTLHLSNGSEVSCHALMLSMGVSWRKLPADGAEKFAGRGVYYGAAMTEAINCQDQEVYIVGAGNSAGQAALFFAKYASTVHMVVRGNSLGAKMSQYLVDRIEEMPNINVRLQTEIVGCAGDGHLDCVRVRNNETEEITEESTGYLFVFIGAAPRTDWLDGVVERDRRGFLKTGIDLDETSLVNWPLERPPFLLETSTPGIFAAGDVRSDSVKRVASAVGEGSVSVHFVHRYLATV